MFSLPLRPAAALFAVMFVVGSGAGSEKAAPYSRRNPIVEAVQKTKPSIVTVKVPRPGGGKDLIGTGVIVDERGYVITNRHVVGANRQVKVCLHDGSEPSADVVVAETSQDLAILRINTSKKLIPALFGPVSDLMVGETVIAVGHPYGYFNTVSTGIISALGREITMPTGDVLHGLIQTNAAINPGNSGGPLLNINGEVIGINVALREGAQNIAFAINAGTVQKMLQRHLSAARIAGVSHGLSCQEKVIAETGPRQKVVVASYAPENVSALAPGDEILTVGDRPVWNSFDIERALWDKKPGEKVELRVIHNGNEITVTLTLTGNGAGQIAALSSKN